MFPVGMAAQLALGLVQGPVTKILDAYVSDVELRRKLAAELQQQTLAYFTRTAELGAEVVHTGIADVHATGHAQAGELLLYHSLVRPEWFIPVHGEYRQMVAHGRIAEDIGIDPDHVMVCEDGDQIVLDDQGVHRGGKVSANYVFVDGIVGDVGRGVLRDRRVLSEEGVVVVIVAVDTHARSVVTGPEIITRGWVYAPEAEDLLEEGAEVVRAELLEALSQGTTDLETLQQRIRRSTGRFVNERTKRRPMIVPVVMEI